MSIGTRPIGTRTLGDSTTYAGTPAPVISPITVSFEGSGDLAVGPVLYDSRLLPVLGNQATFFAPRVRMYYPDFDPDDPIFDPDDPAFDPPDWWTEGAIPEGPMDITGISVVLVSLDDEPLSLVETSGRNWQDQLATDGAGGLTAAEADVIEGESVLRFSLNGETAFQVLVNEVNEVEVSQGEESEQLLDLSGPGAISLLSTASIAPEFGFPVTGGGNRVSIGHISDVRYFNFASKYLVETGWKPAIYTDPEYNTNNWFGRAVGMVDLEAQELWDRPTNVNVPGGDVYFRQWFNYDGPKTITVRVEAAADDEIELWIDNIPILEILGVYAGGMKWTTFDLTPGDHLVAWRGRNRNELRAMTVWSIGTMDSEGRFDEVIAHSDAADAICLGYPDDPPGFPVGQAFRILMLESQDRDEIPYLSTSFGSFYDSNGNEWPTTSELSCRMDQTLLDVVRAWGETHWDVALASYGFEFHGWIRGQRGTNVLATWDKGDEIVGLSRTRKPAPNVAIVRYDTGRVEVLSPDYTPGDVRRVVSLNMGQVRSRSQAAREGRAYLQSAARRTQTIALELDVDYSSLGEQVYTGAWVGDSPLIDGERLRIHGINVSEQDDNFTVVPEVVSAALTTEERKYVQAKQGFPGSGNGTSRVTAPANPIDFPAGREGSEFELGVSWESHAGPVTLKVGTDTLATVNPPVGTKETYVLDEPYRISEASKITVVVDGTASQQKTTDQGIWILAFMVDRDVDQYRGAASIYIAK